MVPYGAVCTQRGRQIHREPSKKSEVLKCFRTARGDKRHKQREALLFQFRHFCTSPKFGTEARVHKRLAGKEKKTKQPPLPPPLQGCDVEPSSDSKSKSAVFFIQRHKTRQSVKPSTKQTVVLFVLQIYTPAVSLRRLPKTKLATVAAPFHLKGTVSSVCLFVCFPVKHYSIILCTDAATDFLSKSEIWTKIYIYYTSIKRQPLITKQHEEPKLNQKSLNSHLQAQIRAYFFLTAVILYQCHNIILAFFFSFLFFFTWVRTKS